MKKNRELVMLQNPILTVCLREKETWILSWKKIPTPKYLLMTTKWKRQRWQMLCVSSFLALYIYICMCVCVCVCVYCWQPEGWKLSLMLVTSLPSVLLHLSAAEHTIQSLRWTAAHHYAPFFSGSVKVCPPPQYFGNLPLNYLYRVVCIYIMPEA